MAANRILASFLTPVVLAACAVMGGSAHHVPQERFAVEVLVDGQPLPVHRWNGARYIEALKGREYAIRIHNPLDRRVAVALSVDGLNSIDARRSTAGAARKWVLGPRETVTISGWQTSRQHARHFFFTTEEDSYAQGLGRPQNIGLISAVFFAERERVVAPVTGAARSEASAQGRGQERQQDSRAAAPAPASESAASGAQKADEYAATGIGRQTDHPVEQVFLDLEPQPAATVDLRYEFRPQLVRLGVLPPHADPLARRQDAQGFEPGFCPEPTRRPR